MKTVITHFYNEEYLLPWWLKHNRKIFDYGIMINYASTDKSVELIKEYCPHWKIVDSRNEFFQSELIDQEVVEYEATLQGVRIALNVTEFLYGDYNILDDLDNDSEPRQVLIPCSVIVDPIFNRKYDAEKQLIDVCKTGLSYKDSFHLRNARSVHNTVVAYDPGRHFQSYNTEDLVIFWHGASPWNDETIERKISFGKKVPQIDLQRNRGNHHLRDREELIAWWEQLVNKSYDMTNEIDRVKKLSNDYFNQREKRT